MSEEEAMTAMSPSHVTARTYDNPLGRASLQRPTPFQLERASVVRSSLQWCTGPTHGN